MEKNYVVYQHVTPDGMYYFGQTQNVEKRWRCNGALYKGTALQPYIEQYGWDNIQHIILFKEQTRENALWIENFLIETAREDGVCINQQRSGLVSKEDGYQQRICKQYYEDNKDKIKEQKRQYYEDNKDKIKQYYEDNKDKIKEQKRQYREQNKDKIQERNKHYYEENKDKIKQYYEDNKDKIKQYYEDNKDKIKQYREQNKDKIQERNKHYYEENKDKIREQRKQRYQRKKEEQQLKELGCLPLF